MTDEGIEMTIGDWIAAARADSGEHWLEIAQKLGAQLHAANARNEDLAKCLAKELLDHKSTQQQLTEFKDDGVCRALLSKLYYHWNVGDDRRFNSLMRSEVFGILAGNDTNPKQDDTWQPIETAPKDGTVVIGFDPERESIWMNGIEFMRWIDGAWSDPTTHRCKPTLWLALPVVSE